MPSVGALGCGGKAGLNASFPRNLLAGLEKWVENSKTILGITESEEAASLMDLQLSGLC